MEISVAENSSWTLEHPFGYLIRYSTHWKYAKSAQKIYNYIENPKNSPGDSNFEARKQIIVNWKNRANWQFLEPSLNLISAINSSWDLRLQKDEKWARTCIIISKIQKNVVRKKWIFVIINQNRSSGLSVFTRWEGICNLVYYKYGFNLAFYRDANVLRLNPEHIWIFLRCPRLK